MLKLNPLTRSLPYMALLTERRWEHIWNTSFRRIFVKNTPTRKAVPLKVLTFQNLELKRLARWTESIRFDRTMTVGRKSKKKAEFGDFQTPIELARKVCSLLSQHGLEPVSILEPTCGRGNFIVAALESFASIRNIVGIDIDSEHVKVACSSVQEIAPAAGSVHIMNKDFFAVDWDHVLESLPDPLLVIGNPPWVTNAELGRIGSSNLPDKSNFQNRRGIDAITGNSNFDISEWMLNKALEWINGREATLAMLCKTAVARKVLHNAWKRGEHLKSSDIANGFDRQPARWMLVPQRIVGEDTHQIRRLAPKTWQYLQRHAQLLDRRASSVYRNRPRFSVFGVGEYSFALWKVAISGFYKKLDFRVVGPHEGKPVVLDDTCYFIACKTKKEAFFIAQLLNSHVAKDFFCAFLFWDEKRPITVGLLKRLDLLALARELDVEDTLKEFLGQCPGDCEQPLLFSEDSFGS